MILPLLVLSVRGLPAQGEVGPDLERAWRVVTTAVRVEARARRPELVPYAERRPGLAPEARDAALRQIRAAWRAGRIPEALAVARRTAARAGETDGAVVEDAVAILLRTGAWAEARDLLAVNLPDGGWRDGWWDDGTPRYALAAVEAGSATPELERLLRASFAQTWSTPPSEIARVYPATPDGLRRLAWATFATWAATREGSSVRDPLAEERDSEGGAAFPRSGGDEAPWATAEAFRRYPDDPIAAYWASFGGRFHRDAGWRVTTPESRRATAEARTRRFAPALRRLRKGDALEGLLRRRIADTRR